MATGILAVGASLHGLELTSRLFTVVAAVGYVVLLGLLVRRATAHGADVLADLRDPSRSFGFFTVVAASSVLSACALQRGMHALGVVLLAVAVLTWLVLGYVVPWMLMTIAGARDIVATANGSWFVWVVASQSVAVAASALEAAGDHPDDGLAVLAVLTWSVGLVLYPVVAVLVLLRLLTRSITPPDVDPSYWVAMGALAITVVAGSQIVGMHHTPLVAATRGLAASVSVVLWSFASWLIPVLVAVGAWRHTVRGVPLRYESGLWSMVFPLGMYAVAGMHLGAADSLPFVTGVGRAWFWVALAAWAAVAAAMVRAILTRR